MGVGNVSVMGAGTLGGGSYDRVRIMGTAMASGEIKAHKMSVMGVVNTGSGIDAETISVMGTGNFAGINSQKVKIRGTAVFSGDTSISDLRISGTGTFGGRVKSDRILVRGLMNNSDIVEAERFISKGVFNINHLNANDIEITLGGKCNANEIGAETVRVYDVKNSWNLIDLINSIFSKARVRELNVEVIEADKVYLENTKAGVVRGNEVRVGPGCSIKTVEYRDRISVDSRSVIGSRIKVQGGNKHV